MGLIEWLNEMLYSSQRVLTISKKPSPEAYWKIITATGASILPMGSGQP